MQKYFFQAALTSKPWRSFHSSQKEADML